MAVTGESSSLIPSNNCKPVIVRVKRKAHQSCLDAFWLEIKERPSKRALIDLENLSLSDLSTRVQEPKRTKLLVQHVETVTTSEVTTDILQSLVSDSPDELQSKGENAETSHRFNTGNKQQQLPAKARQSQEVASQSARFEQIWSRRRDKKEMMHDDDDMVDMCQLYDVVRVDEEKSDRVQRNIFPEVDDDCKMMANFLPLLREVMPTAATEVEDDILDRLNGEASTDTFVFDYYAVKDNGSIIEESTESPFPLVQVQEEEDYYNGPDESEYETDDSNAENNPMNDYPDEESTDENSETESGFPEDLSSSEEEDEEETDESIDGIFLEDGDEQTDWSSYWSKYLREEGNNSEDDGDDEDEDDYDDDEDHDDDDDDFR